MGNEAGLEESPASVLKDYYSSLGVAPDASMEEIRRAYRDQAQVAMADRVVFEALTEAFNTLKDVSRRAAYDYRLRAEGLPQSKTVGIGTTPPQSSQNTTDTTVNKTMMNDRADATLFGGSTATDEGGASASTLSERTVALPAGGFVPGSDKTQGLVLPPCVICQTPGVPGEEFCLECGFLVGSAAGDTVAERPLPKLIDENKREFPLRVGENIVGREGADVMLPDKTVSRRHARIVVEGDGVVWVEDTDSTNGTKRATMPLSPNQRVSLSNGTEIIFGSVKMIVVIPPMPSTARLALPAPVETKERQPIAALAAPKETAGAAPTLSAKLIGKDGVSYTVTGNATFGRKPTNTVVLTNDSFISGTHAQIALENGGYTLTDLGSTNGTKLNGRKVPPHDKLTLQDGDEIVMGQTPFLFQCPAH